MSAYPYLSSEQQQALPELIQVSALPVMYDDSTNRLWHCETVDGPMILKVCDSQNVGSSTFWQGMDTLFQVDLPSQIDKFDRVYSEMSTASSLAIPGFISSSSATENGQTSAFILAKLLSGDMVESQHVDDAMVSDLAEYISTLHQNKRQTWGALYYDGIDKEQWPQRLRETLTFLAGKQQALISNELLSDALSEAETITVDTFVPIMPDLRWDQFLQQDGTLSALVDLDAIVYGPRELELVLLEFLLNEQQARTFIDKYQQTHSLPNLAKVRKSYRLLLFMMNVLGEKNVDAWMQAPTRF